MRSICWITVISLAIVNATSRSVAQVMPPDSLYLGQPPPGKIPVVFNVPVAEHFFAAERIAMTRDGREIYYQELDGYSELDGKAHTVRMKRVVYSGGRWSGPAVLFEGFFCPALSRSEDTLLYQKGIREAYLSVRERSGWSAPRRYLTGLKVAHYDQIANDGERYISSVAPDGIGGIDRCRLNIRETDTVVTSLGLPINTAGHDLDFFVSRDDTYMIVATDRGLCVSYHKPDGGWTNPKNLGSTINFGINSWGPYVTPGSRYLFYTTGTKPDYSDTHIYWVSVGDLIAGLKSTNFTPYVKTKPENQKASAGQPFKFTLPESIFFDDDGISTLTISAALDGGQELPSWLRFDPGTRTFSGTPSEAGSHVIIVRSTDNAGESVTTAFELVVEA